MMNTLPFFQTRWLALVALVFLAGCGGGSGGSGGCSGNCTVPAFHTPPVTISKLFTPSSILPGATSTLSITLANSTTGSTALSGVAISDSLPAGITTAATPNASTTCTAGTVTAQAGSGTVSLAGASIAAGASCTISVNVTGATAGTYTNTIPAGALTTTQGATNTAPATATLTITSPIVVSSCNQTPGQAFALGNAAPFALLGATTITNSGPTVVTFAPGAVTTNATFPAGVNDDLVGVSAGARAITGFYEPAMATGTDADGGQAIYAAQAPGATVTFNTNVGPPAAAQLALTASINALNLLAPTTIGTELATDGATPGTLTPGVYNSATGTFSITAGTLTLDGQNNPQSVFVFQTATTLTTGILGNIQLINKASACNVYFSVGSAATLAGPSFSGNILAGTAISINPTVTTLNGRALAGMAVTIAGHAVPLTITNPGGN